MTLRRFLFPVLSALCLALAAPAGAQDNAIRVVNPDGSVSVLELGAPASAPPSKAAKAAPPTVKETPAAPVMATTPVPRGKPAAPSKQPAKLAVKPPRKPAPVLESAAAAPNGDEDEAPAYVAGQPVDADRALRLALDVAPPSRGYEVIRRTYQDRPVFQVTFRTEDGLHDVLVDAETGDILKR